MKGLVELGEHNRKIAEQINTSNKSIKLKEGNLQDKSGFGIVTNALDKMTKKIIDLINQLGNTSEQLVSSSEELTASAE